MKVHYGSNATERRKDYDYNAHKKAQSDEVDRILEKLKKSGYDSLTTEEKEKLVRRKQKIKRMEHIGKIVAYLILAINAFFVGTLILSAYSPYLSPKVNPLVSCLGLAFPIFLIINLFFLFLLGICQLQICTTTRHRFSDLLSANTDLYSFQLYYPDNTGRKYQSSVLQCNEL